MAIFFYKFIHIDEIRFHSKRYNWQNFILCILFLNLQLFLITISCQFINLTFKNIRTETRSVQNINTLYVQWNSQWVTVQKLKVGIFMRNTKFDIKIMHSFFYNWYKYTRASIEGVMCMNRTVCVHWNNKYNPKYIWSIKVSNKKRQWKKTSHVFVCILRDGLNKSMYIWIVETKTEPLHVCKQC